MLEKLCARLRNYFDNGRRIVGTFTIANGTIDLSEYGNFSYFRVIQSAFNDGVYQYPASGLQDEVFTGAIWLMSVPPAVLDLVERLEECQAALDGNSAAFSPFSSESFGGYSYSRALGVDGGNITAFDVLAGDIKALQTEWGKARV